MNIIKTDLMDGLMYRHQKDQNDGLKSLESSGEMTLKTWPASLTDIWVGLFKQSPEIEPMANSPLQTALKGVMETKEWQNLRLHTKLDEFGASVGTTSFGREFLEKIPQEVIDAENAVADASSALSALLEARNMRNPELIADMRKLANEKRDIAKEKIAVAVEACDGDISQAIRIAARTAATAATEEVNEAEDFSSAWGDSAGMGGHIPLNQQIALANKIKTNETLKFLAKMAGRMKRLAQGYQAKKIEKTPDEIVDVETGNDLKSVLPSELLMLANKLTKLVFYRKYHEKGLLQYKKTGKEKVGKGPIMLLCDESGSMSGKRIIWGKAVGLALAWIAQKQKRDLILGGFSSGGQIWTKEYPQGKITPNDVENYANHFFCGGTDFEMALKRGVSDIKKSKIMKKADLIFISDGDCWCSDRFLKELKRDKESMGLRIISIGVGCSEESFKSFSDVSFGFSGNLDADDPALERVFSI